MRMNKQNENIAVSKAKIGKEKKICKLSRHISYQKKYIDKKK